MLPPFCLRPHVCLFRLLRLGWLLTGAALLAGRAATVDASFTAATDVPISTDSYLTAQGNTLNLQLGYAPAVGDTLKVIDNTGNSPIAGTFPNLPHAQAVTLTYGGIGYPYFANYFGGTGNDLVLEWAGTHAYSWGYSGVTGAYPGRALPAALVATRALSGQTVLAAASGFSHGLALLIDGTVAAWGNNSHGQLGLNSTTDRPTATLVYRDQGVSALYNKTVVAISVGNYHSLALCADGTVAAWGDNTYGQLGDGTTTQRNAPVEVSRASGSALALKRVIAIKAGAYFSLALCSDGKVVAWGLNQNGQLGDGTKDNRSLPVAVSTTAGSALAGKSVTALAAGNYHAMALCSDGSIAAWGMNTDGQLGQANPATGQSGVGYLLFTDAGVEVSDSDNANNFGRYTIYTETSERLIPGAVSTAAGASALAGKTVVAIHAGLAHSYALCSDGTVAAWGDNVSGDLGDGTTTKQNFPVAVNRGNGSALANRRVVALSGGRYFGLALCSDGALVSWGENADGELGDGTATARLLPTRVLPNAFGASERAIKLGAGGSESVFSVVLVAPPLAPDLAVLGRSQIIAAGDVTPSADDDTDFGATSLTTPVVHTFTLQNTGGGPLTLSGSPRIAITGRDAADFTATAVPASSLLAAGSSTSVTISFLPTAGGTRTATVSIDTNVPPDPSDPYNFAKAPYTFAIQGTGPQPSISVTGNGATIANNDFTPSTDDDTDFGNTSSTAPITRTFTIKNTGTQPLNLTGTPLVAVQNSTASNFVVLTQPTSPVAAGSSTTFQVKFTPSTQTSSKAWLTIASDDPSNASFRFAVTGSGATPSIAVSGNGTTIAYGDATPDTADNTDFGTGVLSTAISRVFTISNQGAGSLTLGSPRVSLSGPDAGDFAITQPGSGSIAAGSSTTFTLKYNPAVVGKVSNALVAIASNDPLTPSFVYAVRGTGPTAAIAVSSGESISNGNLLPTTATGTDFGNTTLTTPVTHTFTIKNAGLASLTLTGSPLVAISGANAADFTVTAQPTSPVAAKGGSTTFTLSFQPSAAGVRTATVSIANSSPLDNPFTFAIQGAGPAPSLTVLGNNVAIPNGSSTTSASNFTDFGQLAAGADPVVRTFTLRNDGSLPLTLSGSPVVTLSGATGDFSVSQQPALTTIAAGGSTTFAVTFNPRSSGTRSVVVALGSNDPRSTPFTFTITAVAPPDPGSVGYVALAGSSSQAFTLYPGPMLAQAVSVGGYSGDTSFFLALGLDGKVYTAGDNSTGALGDGSFDSHSDFRLVDTSGALAGKTIVAIAAGQYHSVAVTSDGKLFAWGSNQFGQIGNADPNVDPYGIEANFVTRPTAVAVGEMGTATATQLAVSLDNTTILGSDGKVYYWGGANDYDWVFYDYVTAPTSMMTGPIVGKTVTKISPYYAVTSDNRLFHWHSCDYVPEEVDITAAGGHQITALTSTYSYGFGAVLTDDNKVYSFQPTYNNFVRDKQPITLVPVDLSALGGKKITAISANLNSVLLLTSDGTAYEWSRPVNLTEPSVTRRRVNVLGQGFSMEIVGLLLSEPVSLPTSGVADAYTVANTGAPFIVPAATGVLANDAGSNLTAALVAGPQHGTLTLATDGGFTYTPTVGFFGTDTFTYNAVNSLGSSGPNQVTLNVTAINTAPTLTLTSSAITVLQNTAAYSAGKNFATFSAGPTADSWQTLLGYTVTNDNAALFLIAPAISTSGVLTFTPARGARGVANVTVVARDDGGTDGGGVDSVTKTFTITVTAINDTPTLTLATDYLIAPASAAYTQASFATFSPGRADESAQTLVGGFVVTNNNNAFFATQPAIADDGTLTFTPAVGATGTATVSVKVTDSGGTANSAVNNVTKTFTVAVTSANVAPTLTFAAPTVSVLVNSAAYTSTGAFVTFSPGPASESAQSRLGGYRVASDNPSLFAVQPALATDGTLTFTPVSGAIGATTVSVTAQDDGGTDNGGADTTTNTFTIAIAAPNSAPTVTFASAKVTAPLNAGAQSIAAFATFSPGPAADAGQSLLGYTVTNNANALFAVQPALSNSGTLTFTPATAAVGSATVTVVVRDDGGTAGGGVDSNTATFTIELKPAAGTIVVTTTADSGPGSLRQALLDATAAGTPVTIVLANSLGTLTPSTALPAITGRLTLNAGSGNTLAGTLTVGAGGVLDFGGTTLTGADVVVADGGKLVGSGTSTARLTIGSGGTLSPGASPGVLNFDSATWQGGGTYVWEINDATGTAGTNSDLLQLASTLTSSATTDHPFTLKIRTLTSTFAAGAMDHFDATKAYFWTLVRFVSAPGQPSPVGGRILGFDASAFTIDRTDFVNATAGGRFALYVSGDELQLAFIPNAAPIALADTYDVDQGDTLAPAAAQGVASDDFDAEFNSLTASVATGPAHGQLTLNSDGSFSYAPAADFYGSDTFTYRDNDGLLDSATAATVTIRVHARPVHTIPAAQSLTKNTALAFTGPLAITVADPDSTSLTVDLTVSHGALALTQTTGLTLPQGATGAHLVLTGLLADLNAALATLTYTPSADYVGSDTLALVSTDEGQRTNRGHGSIALTVSAASNVENTAPRVATAIADFSVNENAAASTFDLTTVFTDTETPAASLMFTVPANSNSSLVTSTITGGKTLSLAFAPNATGSAQLTVRATDAGGLTVDATFTVTIADVKPVLTAATLSVASDQPVGALVGVIAATADTNGLTYTIVSGNTGSAIALNATTGALTVNSPAALTGAPFALVIGVDDEDADNVVDSSATFTVNVTVVPPTVSAARIALSGATGLGGAFKIGDTVTATWNNTAAGDNNAATITAVTFDFTSFGGGSAVAATNVSGLWTATCTLVAGTIDATALHVSVTATAQVGNFTTTTSTAGATVDLVAPVVTAAHLSLSGASGPGGAYVTGDTVTATWNGTATGDLNADTLSAVTVDFSAFGGGTAVAASNAAGVWTATYKIVGASINVTAPSFALTATDDAGNFATATFSLAPPGYHSADTDHDWAIGLAELTRVIELYNTRDGTTRTGAYHTATTATEDGFATGPGTITGAYHSADSNHDGRIDLGELTRVIELYNTRNGTTRTGRYHVQTSPATEDGYAPGPDNS